MKGKHYVVNLTVALKPTSVTERVTTRERYREKGEERDMSEVPPLDEQFELMHAIVWRGRYLTFCTLYSRGMFSARSRV